MIENIADKIKAFPPLDESIMKIQRICMDKDGSVKELAETVEKDPMLTANILKAANSPLYGFSREIKNISQAVSLFGMATVRGFALSSAIKHNIKINLEPYGKSKDQFLNIATVQSSLMLNWYGKVNRSLLEILVPASFLMEIGKIILANEIIDQGKTEQFKAKVLTATNAEELSIIEKEFVEVTSEEITSLVFKHWNFEKEMVEGIKYCLNPLAADDQIKPYSIALNIVKKSVNFVSNLEDKNTANIAKDIEGLKFSSQTYLDAIKKIKG